ncbi:MAG: alanine--tRNA ligase [Treponema sp.]
MKNTITANELRSMYIEFFKSKGHKEISGKSLVPENDPTVLFTTAGMHPLVPYISGEDHPQGKRLTDFQKCIRTGDINEVGDASHLTFFEMLGNWSLGDYFKKDSIAFSFEFLTSEKYLGIPIEKISVTAFEGDESVPKDEETAKIWMSHGIPSSHIYFLPREDNWWGPAGMTGPCGPDTEIFIDTGKEPCSHNCKPGCHCGKYLEIWNNVFMQYFKNTDGSYSPLKRACVDTGMGIERTVTILQGKKSVYDTEVFAGLIKKIEELTGVSYGKEIEMDKSIRIIADHIRSSVFILGDAKTITPSNIGAGYVLRRLIRRAVRHGKKLGLSESFLPLLSDIVIEENKVAYPELKEKASHIKEELEKEEKKFMETLRKGEAEYEKMLPNLLKDPKKLIPGRLAFRLYDTYGFPIELTEELAKENGLKVDEQGFNKAFEKHQEISRAGSEQTFKGGLADHSEETTAYHTATHLLHQALRMVLGEHVMQKGSNITVERLRFDFSHPAPMTEEEKKKVEDIVNEQIQKKLPVSMKMQPLEEAKKEGAIALFGEKYDDVVKVYSIGDFSKEVCGGPHVKNTGSLGHFVIKKEQSSSSGVRRIKAVLEK